MLVAKRERKRACSVKSRKLRRAGIEAETVLKKKDACRLEADPHQEPESVRKNREENHCSERNRRKRKKREHSLKRGSHTSTELNKNG